MTFSPTQYSRLKLRLTHKYRRDLVLISKSLAELPPSKFRNWWLQQAEELEEYSPFKWYFLQQVRTFVFLKQMLPLLSEKTEEFSQKDDEVFEIWNKSEFADVFLKALNRGRSVKQATREALKEMDQHLWVLGERHLLRHNKVARAYRVQASLGEIKKGRNISRMLETTLHLEGKDLNLFTHSLKEMKHLSQRIEVALKVIKKFSPSSWERFKAFTDVVVPIKQHEFVSYSHQDLPGQSMINLYDRDFVDLMDDLLHENGHHHLNFYLNLGKLIEEPAESIYYSPWRRTLRPLRGIFHAYFTFFWAFNFFAALASAKEQDSIYYVFGKAEKEKIYWRAVEEWWMLDFTYQDLIWAKRKGLIGVQGWRLIQEQRRYLNKFKSKIPLWEKKLRNHRSELKDLKATLRQANRQFSRRL